MNRRPYLLDSLHPLAQLLLLIGISFVFFSAVFFFSLYLTRPLFGITGIDTVMENAVNNPEAVGMNPNQVNALKFIQFMQTLGLFLIPALVFARMKFPEGDYLRLNSRTSLLFIVLGVLILVTATPFIDFTIYLNQHLQLPSFMSGLEQWSKESEQANEKLTQLFLKTPHQSDLWIDLIVIAIIPAISEEIFFRGCIQQVLKEWTKNSHWAVWITAMIFSAAHIELHAFIPRLLLGALLGYLFIWSGSLWIPIVAHAFNNGAQIMLSYLHEHGTIQYDIQNSGTEPVVITIIATILSAGLIWLYRRILAERKFIY